MSYPLILELGLHHELRYIFPFYQYAVISAQKIITFFHVLPSGNETSERESNPIPKPLYLYLSRSTFLVSFTDKQLKCKIS